MNVVAYEHEFVPCGRGYTLDERHWEALLDFRSGGGGRERFFDVVRGGIKLKSYVGVLSVGGITLEILPKVDSDTSTDEQFWRGRLIDMLRVSMGVSIHHPTTASLNTRPDSLLEYYLTLFAEALERLVRGGLIRDYRGRSGNRTALRGRLMLTRHLTANLVHRERFYMADTTYDLDHRLNRILRMALDLSFTLARDGALRQRIAELNVVFPELQSVHISESVFERIHYDRHTECYRPAVEIAQILLLNFHPDVRGGENDMLALLFNMNQLWERFLLASLQRFGPEAYTFEAGRRREFWRGDHRADIRPDIVVNRDDSVVTVFDAKWKRSERPASGDLYQLYAYARSYGVDKVALLYPGSSYSVSPGTYTHDGIGCDVVRVPVSSEPIQRWMQSIAESIMNNVAAPVSTQRSVPKRQS